MFFFLIIPAKSVVLRGKAMLHKGLLCLRGEKMLARFQKMGYANTLSDIRNALIVREALYLDSEGKNKKIGNMRVYGIYLNKLD